MMTYTLFAQDPPAPPASAPAGGKAPEAPFFLQPQFMLLIMGLFLVLVILPQSRRAKREQAALLTNLKRGAKVVTTSGIIGVVVNLKENEDEVTIRSEDAKLKVLKSTIARVIGQDESEAK